MNKEIEKAAQELLNRLRRTGEGAQPEGEEGDDQGASLVYINAPSECVIYIGPSRPRKGRGGSGTPTG